MSLFALAVLPILQLKNVSLCALSSLELNIMLTLLQGNAQPPAPITQLFSLLRMTLTKPAYPNAALNYSSTLLPSTAPQPAQISTTPTTQPEPAYQSAQPPPLSSAKIPPTPAFNSASTSPSSDTFQPVSAYTHVPQITSWKITPATAWQTVPI